MTTDSQHKAPPAGLAGTVDHLDAGDGWILVRLMTRQAMDREGAHMHHCLGDGSYDELAGDEELTGNAIWSLRDPDGVSWATLDVRRGTVVMAKGPGNRTVRKSAARRLSALVTAFRETGRDLGFAGETDLLVAADGRVMREDQAPAAIREEVRARHRASMAAHDLRDSLSRRLRSNTAHGIVRLPDGTVYPVVFNSDDDNAPTESAAPPVLPQREDGEPRRPPLTELFRSTASMPNPVVEVGRNADFLTGGSNWWAKLRDGTVIECPGPGLNTRPDEADFIVACLLYERVRAMQPAQETVALGVDSQAESPIADVVETPRLSERAVEIVATVSTTPPGTVDIRQDEAPRQSVMAPAGSWIGRIHANRMARMPPFGRVHSSLLKEHLWNLWDGEAIPIPTAGELDQRCVAILIAADQRIADSVHDDRDLHPCRLHGPVRGPRRPGGARGRGRAPQP